MLKNTIAAATMAVALVIPTMRYLAVPAIVYVRPVTTYADSGTGEVQVQPAYTAAPATSTPVHGRRAVELRIDAYAAEYGVSAQVMKDLVACETAHTWDPAIQSGHIRPDGTREKSFGLAQIHLPAHPDVTLEQATDPEFALEWMAKKLAAGERRIWSC